jgi:hypothetical protein
LKHRGFCHIPDFGVQCREPFGHFVDVSSQCASDGLQATPMVSRTERLGQTRGTSGYQAVGTPVLSLIQQRNQESRGQLRHIAGHHQIPVGFGVAENSVNAGKGTAARDHVGDHWPTQMLVNLRLADQADRTGGNLDEARDMLHQRPSPIRKKGLIPAHSRAFSPCQDPARLNHPEMIPLGLVDFCGKLLKLHNVYNIKMGICFIMLSFMLLSPTAMSAEPVPATPAKVTYVVRADSRSGRLVRSSAPVKKPAAKAIAKPVAKTSPQIQLPAPPDSPVTNGWKQVVRRIAEKHAVDTELVDSVVRVESNYNPFAVSMKGARGLMQLEPETARRFGAGDGFSPAQNVDAGVRYLKYLLESYHGDHRLALAAYNAGEGAVERWGGVPPYPETRRYVYEVGKRFGDAKDARKPVPEAKTAEQTGDGYNPILAFVDATGRIFYRTP